ncbi:hypothetical protein WN944_023036 [Citrus x changshan-huyou]|uniref:Uncharacterized protein n=1 Tax=Citrus x changshan-huyou TaxID=2935761 RepID=A0AAP0R0U5_9ROSI
MAVYIAADISDEDFEDVKSTARNKIPEYMLELEFMLGPDKPLTSARHGEKGISKKTLLSNELRGGGPSDADKVTHVYMRTLNDQLLKLQEQHSMITKWSPSQVFDINSDHLPFLLEPAYSLWQSGSTSCFNQLIFMPC